jgi:hypothetical protein
MNFFEVGIQSYEDLSSAFVATLVGRSTDRLAGICGSSQGGTVFYLDPFDSGSSSTGKSSCIGTDWVGESISTTQWGRVVTALMNLCHFSRTHLDVRHTTYTFGHYVHGK